MLLLLSDGPIGVVPCVTHLLEDHKLILRSRALVDLIFISAGGGEEKDGMTSPIPITQAANTDHGKRG